MFSARNAKGRLDKMLSEQWFKESRTLTAARSLLNYINAKSIVNRRKNGRKNFNTGFSH